MAKEIKITGNEWISLVFAGRNQAYGAYDIRKNTTKRHLIAYVVIVCLAIVLIFLPRLMEWIIPQKVDDTNEVVTSLSDIQMEVPEENLDKQFEAPPPPPLKSTIKFTSMQVVEDEKVAEEEEVKTMEELVIAKEAISIADVVGTDELEGKDIADLEEHKVIVEAKEEVFLVGAVEQNPEFPGGMEALYKWINNEMRYPAAAQEMGIAGRVTMQFTVWKDGSIRDIQVLRGVETSLDKEATRVVGKMPKWIPGKQGGREVSVRYILPIVFQIK
ncbi:MAG: energy transducer TonB [Prevotellaceae bacterium]|jgi:protein TonB|nr:energy transducer TonB [Prevotellaceae bacterium]